jgi:hypothetical protein
MAITEPHLIAASASGPTTFVSIPATGHDLTDSAFRVIVCQLGQPPRELVAKRELARHGGRFCWLGPR